MLCNAGFPFLAFIKAPLEKRFIDIPQLAEQFAQLTGFQPLSAAFLNQPLVKKPDSEFLALLSEFEIKDIMDWSPDRVGDAIFNEWD